MMHSFINSRWRKILKTIYVDREIKKMCRGCVDELGMLLYLGITASCKKKILVKISSYFMMEEKRGRINLKYGRRDWYM